MTTTYRDQRWTKKPPHRQPGLWWTRHRLHGGGASTPTLILVSSPGDFHQYPGIEWCPAFVPPVPPEPVRARGRRVRGTK
jgi:hypothetical protein